jgi:hypothetical protein
MDKNHFKNLFRAYRSIREFCTVEETLNWIAPHGGESEKKIIQRVVL